jgi:hypothetical protein
MMKGFYVGRKVQTERNSLLSQICVTTEGIASQAGP